ncbi:unnamed protein product [Dovyalis caffra]|uniref:GDSL esterase/lipase 1-like n=1 Tax=Dovyalis caffra TaxID=77055 RepID=A0AAV1RQE6_9ROSI|nr:unnamed protein product [Dovyalis caffra]
MGTWRFNSICFLVFCAILLNPTSSHSYSDVALFIFGDSYYDAGNNNYFKNASAEFAKLPLIPPYLQPGGYHQFRNGVNFASGGAGALVETNQGILKKLLLVGVDYADRALNLFHYLYYDYHYLFLILSSLVPSKAIDLKTQLSYFKNLEKQLRQKLGASEVKKLLSTAVYMLNIGSNDYLSSFLTNSTVLQSYSREESVKMVIGNLTTVIQEIYKIGGRKFGISNMAVLGCVPALRALKLATTGGSGCMDEPTVLAKLHNRAIPKAFKVSKRRKWDVVAVVHTEAPSLVAGRDTNLDLIEAECTTAEDEDLVECTAAVVEGDSTMADLDESSVEDSVVVVELIAGDPASIRDFEGDSSRVEFVYGKCFKEVEEACCGSGPYGSFKTCGREGYRLCDNASEYFFFDSAHPTESVNYQFAKLMWSGSSDIVKPYNLKTLFEE